MSVAIGNVKNHYSTRPVTNKWSLEATDAANSNAIIAKNNAIDTTEVTTTAGTMTAPADGITETSQVSAVETKWTFHFTTANPIPIGGVVHIINPSAATYPFTMDTTTGCGVAGGTADWKQCTADGSGGVYVESKKAWGAGDPISIGVSKFTNANPPSPTASFTIRTYDDNTRTYIIDEITGKHIPQIKCDAPCKNCDTNVSSTHCTDCFEPAADGKIYLDTQANTCVTACGTE